MRIRNGFVSNSSSSSFIIAVKGDADIKKIILDAFKVDKDSPIYYLVEEAAEIMASTQEFALEELLDEIGDSLAEFYDRYPQFKGVDAKGFTKYIYGSAADDGEIAETLLCDLDIHYKDDSVIIEKEGGY